MSQKTNPSLRENLSLCLLEVIDAQASLLTWQKQLSTALMALVAFNKSSNQGE